MEFKDYYELLEVGKNATPADIKRAYRRLARKYHPDVNPGDRHAESRFKDLNEAHEVLSDPEKRRKYDALGARWRQYERAPDGWPGPFGGPAGGADWNVNVGGRPFSENEFREVFSGGGFSDFFETFFRDQTPRGSWRSDGKTPRGLDVEYRIELTLEDAFRGVSRRLTLPPTQQRPSRTLEVKIPSGVRSGSRVRVTGEGEAGTHGGEPGDLYLNVELRPHAIFTVQGQNLYVSTDLPALTAVLGGEVEVPTLDGPTARLKIPAGTQPGQVFRLRDRGLPGLRRHTKRGDLYVTARVTIPRRLSPAARRHYEALADLERGATKPYSQVEP